MRTPVSRSMRRPPFPGIVPLFRYIPVLSGDESEDQFMIRRFFDQTFQVGFSVNVRPPRFEMSSDDGARRWHPDCGHAPQTLIVWATAHPTEFRRWKPTETARRQRWTAQPYVATAIDNGHGGILHRYPYQLTLDESLQSQRWFVVVRTKYRLSTIAHQFGR